MDDQQQNAPEPLPEPVPPDHLLEANAEPDPPQAAPEDLSQTSEPETPHIPPLVDLSEITMPQPPTSQQASQQSERPTPPANPYQAGPQTFQAAQTFQPSQSPQLTQWPQTTQPVQPQQTAQWPQNPQPPQPIVPPLATAPEPSKQKDAAKNIVMQWLSYSLWVWSIVTISTILSSSLTYFLVHSDSARSYEWQIYFIAAMVCLVPASFFVDRAYSKHEEPKKHGFAAVVMVLNAVGVFLCALGSSIAFVVGLLMTFIHSSDSDGIKVTLIASAVTAFLTYALFFRILYLVRFKSYNRLFRYVMVGVSLLALILSIMGPFTNEIRLKNDRLIESGLPGVSDAVSSYASKNKKLPASLKDVEISSYQKDTSALVKKGLVEYIKESNATAPVLQSTSSTSYFNSSYSNSYSNSSSDLNLKYQLCVTYKAAKKVDYNYGPNKDDYTSSYVSTYSHDAGRQCYKLKATGY